jgi:hypothetical protein
MLHALGCHSTKPPWRADVARLRPNDDTKPCFLDMPWRANREIVESNTQVAV